MTEPIDIVIERDVEGIFDIQFDSTGDILSLGGLDTSIKMSVFEERRADASEEPDSVMRRGWIGNLFSDDVPFENGSKLWLYEQSRLTPDIVSAVEDVTLQAVTWLVDDQIAEDVSVEAISPNGVTDLLITLQRSNSPVEFRFFDIWNLTPRSV